MEFVSNSILETSDIASKIMGEIKENGEGATVFGLYGNLGSGKTTFMKFVGEFFGISDSIQSPTFVIMRKYAVNQHKTSLFKFEKLIHIDAYRIEKTDEMIVLGWQEIIKDKSNIIFVEWPERIKDVMPEHLKIFFEHGEKENQRIIKFRI